MPQNLPGKQPSDDAYLVNIMNNSDCLLLAVTVMKVTFKEDGTLQEMELYWGEWLEPGQVGQMWAHDGDYYYLLIEAFFWDPDTKKATERAGEMYREGYYDHNDPSSGKIDVRCWHTELKDA